MPSHFSESFHLCLRSLCWTPKSLWSTPLVKMAMGLGWVGELTTLLVNPCCLIVQGDHSCADQTLPSFLRTYGAHSGGELFGWILSALLPKLGSGRRDCNCFAQFTREHVMLNAWPRSDSRSSWSFVSGMAWLGKAVSKKCLARWLCKCISYSYTHGVAVSTAVFSVVCVEDICTGEAWTMSWSFMRLFL